MTVILGLLRKTKTAVQLDRIQTRRKTGLQQHICKTEVKWIEKGRFDHSRKQYLPRGLGIMGWQDSSEGKGALPASPTTRVESLKPTVG